MTDLATAAPPPARSRRASRVTVRVRLILALAVLFALGLAGFGLVTTSLYSRSLSDRLDSQLRAAEPLMMAHLLNQAGLSAGSDHHPGSVVPPSEQSTGQPSAANGGQDPSLLIPPGTWGELVGSDGTVLKVAVASDSTGKPTIPASLPAAGTIITVPGASGTSSWRLTASPSPNGTTTVVAVSTADLDASMARLITIELLVGCGLLLILSSASFLIITHALRPLESMAETASAITEGDLSKRVEVATSARELDELRRALNTMLDKIEASFAEREVVERKLRQFLADASHELRTPLTSIAGFAEILRLGGTDAVDPSLAASRIESEAARMTRLVDDLLILARMDETRSQPLGPVDLSIIAADACSDATAVDPSRTITLEAPESVVVAGIEDHLRQAVTNLIANALRYTPSGSPITVVVERAQGRGLITVNDRGPGIPEDQIPKIFDRFFQVDPSRTGAGSGLGLSIVSAACEESGGSASAKNRPSGGLAISIAIPLLRLSDSEATGP